MTATKTTRLVRTTSSASYTLRLDTGEVAHVGVDVHKASYHVAVVTDLRGPVATWTQPASPELLSSNAWTRSASGSPRSSTRPAPPASLWSVDSGSPATAPR